MQMTIEGADAAQFFQNFQAVANRFGFVSKEQAVAVAQAAVAKATSVPAENKPAEPQAEALKPVEGEVLPPEKPKRGRPPKPVEKSAEPETPKPEALAAEEKPLTTDDVRAAMKALAARCGVEAVGKLLAEFGVAKASEVPAEKIADFVAKSESWGAA